MKLHDLDPEKVNQILRFKSLDSGLRLRLIFLTYESFDHSLSHAIDSWQPLDSTNNTNETDLDWF